MSTKTETTNVQEVDVDLNDLLGTGINTVMTANEDGSEEKKDNNFFGRGTPDTTFLDKPVTKEKSLDPVEPVAVTEKVTEKSEPVEKVEPVEPTEPISDIDKAKALHASIVEATAALKAENDRTEKLKVNESLAGTTGGNVETGKSKEGKNKP